MSAIDYFGHLYEGMQANSQTPPEVLGLLRSRYKQRVLLSDLVSMPEGYEFRFEVSGKAKAVILLSPPNVVAIHRGDGQWYRVSRNILEHGPSPYSRSWYQNYLEENTLPGYFLQAGHHNHRIDLTEADILGLKIEDLPTTQTMTGGIYLTVRYPARPMVPDTSGQTDIRALVLTEKEHLAVARRFPATCLLKGQGKRVFVHPGGYITIPDDNRAAANVPTMEAPVTWVQNPGVGSYVVTGTHENYTLPGGVQLVSVEDRRTLLHHAKKSDSYIVNPKGIPKGYGQWGWLSRADEKLAEALNYPDHADLAIARDCGMLSAGSDEALLPVILWRPVAKYFNPEEKPAGSGEWHFLTEGDRDLGKHRLTGRVTFSVDDLSAAQVWEVREHCIQNRHNDFTHGINIVWIPKDAEESSIDAPSPTAGSDVRLPSPSGPARAPLFSPSPPPAPKTPEPDLGFGVDTHTRLAHEPTNGGTNDQTAADVPGFYQTRMLGGKKVTIDRSRARVNIEEPHKLWVCDSTGEFRQHPSAQRADWTDKAFVSRVNRWREQTLGRHEWPSRRFSGSTSTSTSVRRADYTPAQRDWMFERIVEARGGNPPIAIELLAREFNQAFPDDEERTWHGLQGLIDRLRGEYRVNGGKQKDAGARRKRRGVNDKPIGGQMGDAEGVDGKTAEEWKAEMLKMPTQPNPSTIISRTPGTNMARTFGTSGFTPINSTVAPSQVFGEVETRGLRRKRDDPDYVPSDQSDENNEEDDENEEDQEGEED